MRKTIEFEQWMAQRFPAREVEQPVLSEQGATYKYAQTFTCSVQLIVFCLVNLEIKCLILLRV